MKIKRGRRKLSIRTRYSRCHEKFVSRTSPPPLFLSLVAANFQQDVSDVDVSRNSCGRILFEKIKFLSDRILFEITLKFLKKGKNISFIYFLHLFENKITKSNF